MDRKNVTGGGVKVTYIETQFVTSDAAGFKDLVQRLTGRSSSAPPPPAPHRPLPCRPDDGRRPRGTTTAAVPQRYHHHYTAAAEVRRPPPPVTISSTPTSYLEDGDVMGMQDFIDMDDFSDLFYDVGASDRSDGCYGGFPY